MDDFPINTVNVFCLPHDLLNHIFFSLAYFIVRTQCMIQTTYKMCVNRLSVVPVRISVNSRLVVDEFGRHQKFDADFLLCVAGGRGHQHP